MYLVEPAFDSLLSWEQPESWFPYITTWLEPQFRRVSLRRLGETTRELYDDDPDWRAVFGRLCRNDFDYVANLLASALCDMRVTTYHGCRTEDASSYFTHGLQPHRRESLERIVRDLVRSDSGLGGRESMLLAPLNASDALSDEGKCYVVLDKRGLLDDAAHYLIYGSEFVLASLGYYRHILKKIGVPTLLHIELPLSMCDASVVLNLAELLLQEWTRLRVRTGRPPLSVDFSFTLREVVPAKYVVRHEHPLELRDPLEEFSIYRSSATFCKYCQASRR